MHHMIPLDDSLKILAAKLCDNRLTDMSNVCANVFFFVAGWNSNDDIQLDMVKKTITYLKIFRIILLF